MFNKINYNGILVSVWIGIAISISSQILLGDIQSMSTFFTVSLSGGGLGLFIGLFAEGITALFPITIAKPKTYFLISTLIGMAVTVIVLISINTFIGSLNPSMIKHVIYIALGVISVANIIDFLHYKKTNMRLETYKNQLGK